MSTRKLIVILFFVILAGMAVTLLPAIYTTRDLKTDCDHPDSFFISDTSNRIDYQDDGRSGAYAAAYIMRHFGKDTSADELFFSVNRRYGFTSPGSIAKLLRENGYEAKARCGDIETLKHHVSAGNPVIVFIRIPHDTHYAVVTGYDTEYIYMADSLRGNANADEPLYNRKISIAEFKELWKTHTLVSDNVYITVKKR